MEQHVTVSVSSQPDLLMDSLSVLVKEELRWVKLKPVSRALETGFHARVGQNADWNNLLKPTPGILYSFVPRQGANRIRNLNSKVTFKISCYKRLKTGLVGRFLRLFRSDLTRSGPDLKRLKNRLQTWLRWFFFVSFAWKVGARETPAPPCWCTAASRGSTPRRSCTAPRCSSCRCAPPSSGSSGRLERERERKFRKFQKNLEKSIDERERERRTEKIRTYVAICT